MPKPLRDIHEAILAIFKAKGVGVFISIDQLNATLPTHLRHQRGLARRLRELRSRGGWDIPNHKRDGTSYYVLKSDVQRIRVANADPISGKLQAKIRLQANGRCLLCGKTIVDDHIKLVVDHRVPREWGGETVEDNLWAICETCNNQKRDYISTLPKDIMSLCMGYDEPIQRIGELLKAFKGEVVPRWLLSAVGMDDEWTRRLRELRDLGWVVVCVRVKGEVGSRRFSYKLLQDQPWPEDIRAAIKLAASRRGSKSL